MICNYYYYYFSRDQLQVQCKSKYIQIKCRSIRREILTAASEREKEAKMARSNSNSNNRPASYHQASSSQPQQRINNGRHQSAASSSSTTGAKARDADNCCSVKFVKNVLHMFNIIFFVSRPEWVHCTVYCTVLYYTPPHFAICTLTSTYVTTCHNSKCIENHVAFIIHCAVIIDS